MKQQPDTTTNSPEQTRWQRWQMKPRDRYDWVALYVLVLVQLLALSPMVSWIVLADWPIWLTVLALLALWGVLVALFCLMWHLWYRRRTPVAAAS